MKIRPIQESDIETLKELNRKLFASDKEHLDDLDIKWPDKKIGQDYYEKIARQEDCIGFFAEKENEVIGYVSVTLKEVHYRTKKYALLENIFVLEQYRNEGVGKILMEQVCVWAKRQGSDRLLVNTFANNTKAINFYEKNNFYPVGITLEKELN